MDDFIGIFDSGIGGLTVYSKILEVFKNENIVYLADTKNCPYGTKDINTVKEITLKNIEYLKNLGAKIIIIACNTATSSIIDIIDNSNYYLLGVIQPTALYALEHSSTKTIGLLATNLTVSTKVYEKYLVGATVYSEGCSDLVMPIEKGLFHSKSMKKMIRDHLQKLGKVDTLILGCTHFPYIKEEIQEFLPEVKIIESGEATALYLKKYFEINNFEVRTKHRKLVFLTTGDLEKCSKQIAMLNYQFDVIKEIKI
ncbi:MAG: glutamate racemase [Staphylococcus sp.]|jgi:glutamate racemase|nr:glutamate racemase [Staphylococcus sp.]